MLAVSSSPTPWIDVSSLPEKSNMAMTESDPDPMVRTIALPTQWLEQCPLLFNDCATSELSMRTWN